MRNRFALSAALVVLVSTAAPAQSTPDGDDYSVQTNDGFGDLLGVGPGSAGKVLTSNGPDEPMTMERPAIESVESSAWNTKESNYSTHPTRNTVDPLVGVSSILAPCDLGASNQPCHIGRNDAKPRSSVASDFPVDTGYRPGTASFSSITGGRDNIVNALASWIGHSNHSMIYSNTSGGSAGHNAIVFGSGHRILGDCEYSAVISGHKNWVDCLSGNGGSESGELIVGGRYNAIDMTNVVTTRAGDNSILTGRKNRITASGGVGMIHGSIGNCKNCQIDNPTTALLESPTIPYGKNNEITAVSHAPHFAKVEGYNGQAWTTGQRVFSNGGYWAGHEDIGALQHWKGLVRKHTRTAYKASLSMGYGGGWYPSFIENAVWHFKARWSCYEDVDLSREAPSKLATYETEGVAIRHSGSRRVLYDGATGEEGSRHAVSPNMIVGIHEEDGSRDGWESGIEFNRSAGTDVLVIYFYAHDDTDAFCQGDFDVVSTRMDY